jgi:hypothetical protein
VEGKFLANCGEASDLSIGLVFESHLRRNTAENGIGQAPAGVTARIFCAPRLDPPVFRLVRNCRAFREIVDRSEQNESAA